MQDWFKEQGYSILFEQFLADVVMSGLQHEDSLDLPSTCSCRFWFAGASLKAALLDVKSGLFPECFFYRIRILIDVE